MILYCLVSVAPTDPFTSFLEISKAAFNRFQCLLWPYDSKGALFYKLCILDVLTVVQKPYPGNSKRWLPAWVFLTQFLELVLCNHKRAIKNCRGSEKQFHLQSWTSGVQTWYPRCLVSRNPSKIQLFLSFEVGAASDSIRGDENWICDLISNRAKDKLGLKWFYFSDMHNLGQLKESDYVEFYRHRHLKIKPPSLAKFS